MNPPIVYEVTKPRSQRTTKMTAMVQSIFHHLPDYSHGNPARLPSVSASVRNASRRLSDSRIGVCPRAGRGAGGFGSLPQFVLDGVMGYFRVGLHPRLQQDVGPIAADRLHAQAQLLGD